MKKNLLIILFLMFIFIPGLSADTYYDWELIEVESLPAASEEFLNKVYQVSDKYYIIEKNNNDYTPIPLNEDLKGKIIYFDYKSLTYEILDDIYNNNSIIQNSSYINKTETSNSNANTKKQYQLWRNSQGNIKLNHYTFYFPYLTFVSPRVETTYVENGEVITPVTSFSSNFSYSISEWYAPELEKYFSLTPFETSYIWKEVLKSDVIENKLPEEDFYLFFSFDDIKQFNILSIYNLDSFDDFQKIIITLGFNIFFLCFVGLCIYIFIKLFNKGYSFLFR